MSLLEFFWFLCLFPFFLEKPIIIYVLWKDSPQQRIHFCKLVRRKEADALNFLHTRDFDV